MVRSQWVKIAVVVMATFFVGGIAAAAGDRLKLGTTGIIINLPGVGDGIGVDAVEENSIADQLGVINKSFIYRIKVEYGKKQVDERRTDSFTAVKEALDHDDVYRITLVWRKNRVWWYNTYYVARTRAGKEEQINDQDKKIPEGDEKPDDQDR